MSIIVEMTKLTKTFGKGSSTIKALDGVDLKIKTGDFIAIIGPSGSGKSTLMNMIGCLDKPTSGSIRIMGKDLNVLSDKQTTKLRNRTIGFVFQSFFLLPNTTALDNVATPLYYRGTPAKEARKKAMEILGKLDLSDRYSHLPTELSGGQQQRVAIARALVTDPNLILADEPTGALDSKNGQQVLDLLTKLNSEGKTIVLITHDKEIANRAKKIIRIKDGKITESTRA
jgi:putative ABC transport system ATP-binding protein